MVRQMLMVFLGIMISQSMPLLIGGIVDASERFVESKLLEWLQSGCVVAAEMGCSWSVAILNATCLWETVEDPARLKGGVALAPDPALKRLRGIPRPMFLIRLDPVLWGWWPLRFVNTSRLDVSSTLKSEPTTGALLLLW
jgi:hypothetical protein